MKKLLSLCLAFFLVLGSSACANNKADESKMAEDAVAGYFDALRAGKWEEASEFVSDSYSDPLDIEQAEDYLESLLEVYDYGETFESEAKDFMTNVMKSLIASYEIKGVEKEDEKFIVNVDVVSKDYSNLDLSSVQTEANDYMEQYANDNMAKIQEVYQNEGEDAAMELILKDVSGYLFDTIEKVYAEAPEVAYSGHFEVENDEGEYKITDGQLN